MEQFWSKVQKTSDGSCWEWLAGKSDGYGSIRVKRKRYHAHRFSWIIAKGEIPDDMCILHKCDNRGCVNPDHLFIGTKKDNTQDMVSKGRNVSNPANFSGPNHYMAKFTENQVREIRRLKGIMKSCEVAHMYGVGKHVIGKLFQGRTYRCVSDIP